MTYSKLIFFTILIFTVISNSVTATPLTANRPFHVIEQLNSNVYINWTSGWIYSKVTVPIKRPENLSLTEARLRAVRTAKEMARTELSHGILLLRVDANGSFGDYLSKSERLAQGFADIEREYKLLEHTTGEGSVTIRLGSSLFGSSGLIRRLENSKLNVENQNQIRLNLPVAADKFSGLMIFIQPSISFMPSLRPSLSLSSGQRILPLTDNLKGNDIYFKTEEESRNYGRAGERPFKLFAVSALDSTDIIIDDLEAQRILGNKSLLEAVSLGRVVIILLNNEK